ncbi:MAG: hypothetical protein ACOC85_01880 [Thermoplasmatota archaeon]
MKNKLLALGLAFLLLLVLVSSGCTDENGENGNGSDDEDLGDQVKQASSLKYTITVTHPEEGEFTQTFMAKNIGTDDVKLRMEWDSNDDEGIFILNHELKKAWIYSDGVWEDLSEWFEVWYDTYYVQQFEDYMTELYDWTGGEYTYTEPSEGITVTFSGIQIDPSLSDSLFEH